MIYINLTGTIKEKAVNEADAGARYVLESSSKLHTFGPSGYLSGIHDIAIYPIQEINEPLSRAG